MTEDKKNIENDERTDDKDVKAADVLSEEQIEETAFLKEEAEKAKKEAAEAEAKREEAESKLTTALSQYVRLQADFDNFRRRTRENEAKATDMIRADTLKAFLPVVDNFEMALLQIKKSNPGDAFIQGVEMLIKQFVKVLNDFGVTEMDSLGKPFDPYFHEAIMQTVSDELEDDTVSLVLKKGYMYKDEVLRHAAVQVSHKP